MSDRDLEPLDPDLEDLLAADRPIPDVPDEVRARVRRRVDATVSGAAVPLRRRRLIAASAVAVAAAAALAVWLGTRPDAGDDAITGAATVESRRSIALGDRGTAIAESGADLAWTVAADGETRVEQRAGSVLYKVAPGADFVVTTPYGTARSLGTTFRVEMEPAMTKKMKRTAIGTAVVAAAVVTVYSGRVLVASSDGEAEVGPGEQAVLTAGQPPATRANVSASDQERAPEVSVSYGDDPAGDLRLEGQVIDADEIPVAGAVVTLDARPPRTATTEADGSFAFDALLPRTYSLLARSGDSFAGPVSARLTATSDPVILRARAGATLEVEVVDAEDRTPIAGAEVDSEHLGRLAATTGDDGVARLRGVGPGYYPVRAVAPGYAPASQEIHSAGAAGSVEHLTIALERGAAVWGVVVDPDGKPVEGATVTARPASESILFGGAPETAETNAQGAWLFPALAAGTYELDARHPRHARGPSVLETLDGVTERRGVELTVDPGAELRGRVVSTSGNPVPHATVRVIPKQRRSVDAEVRQVHADKGGAFTVEGLPREAMTAIAYHERGSDRVDVDLAEDDADVEIVLRHDGVLAGVVVDPAGEPVADAQVVALPADAFDATARWLLAGNGAGVTDPGGRFELAGLAPGEYRVRALRPSRGGDHRMWSPFGNDGERATAGTRDLRLVLPADGAVSGKVVLADGEVPETFTVSLGWGKAIPFHATDGEFSIADVPPGSYRLHVDGPGMLGHHDTELTVAAGETTDAGTIVVTTGRSIRGRVVTAGGAPVAGATVAAGRFLVGDGKGLGDLGMDMAKTTTTGDDGRFEVFGVGNFQLVVAADHPTAGRSSIHTAPAGDDDVSVELVVSAPGAIEGRVTRGGEPVAAIITARPTGLPFAQFMVQTTADGRYRFDRLPPGEYGLTAKKMGGGGMVMISASSARGARDAVATVPPGETARADIEIPVGPTVQIDVVDGAGDTVNSLVHLVRGRVTAQRGEELFATLEALGEDASRQAPLIIMEGGHAVPAIFENVEPARYTACALKLPPMDHLGGGTEMASADGDMPVTCAPLEVTAGPERQTAKLAFPE